MEKLRLLVLNHYHLCSELKELGHEVFTVGWGQSPAVAPCDHIIFDTFSPLEKVLDNLPAGFNPTHILYHDNSGPPHISGLERCSIPSIFYAVDTHIHAFWQRHFAMGFDTVCIAQKDHVADFSEIGVNAVWLPLWAQHKLEPAAEKNIDLCFRGNFDPGIHPHRVKFFEELSRLCPGDYSTGPYAEAYVRSKIVVNQALNKDVNFRVFESLMSGALLITPEIQNGLSDLFTPGQHLVTYKSGEAQDAADKIHVYLENEPLRAGIAQRGRQEVVEKHTALVRAEQLAGIMQNSRSNFRAEKLIGPASCYLTFFANYLRFSLPIACSYLEQSADCLLKYARNRAALTDFFIQTLLQCQFYLEQIDQKHLAQQLTEAISACYPENEVLRLSRLRGLLSSGLTQQACDFAAASFADQKQAFEMSNNLFSSFSSPSGEGL